MQPSPNQHSAHRVVPGPAVFSACPPPPDTGACAQRAQGSALWTAFDGLAGQRPSLPRRLGRLTMPSFPCRGTTLWRKTTDPPHKKMVKDLVSFAPSSFLGVLLRVPQGALACVGGTPPWCAVGEGLSS